MLAARAVAGAVRATLGPKGTDETLVDASGDVVVANGGVTVPSEMEIDHPGAQVIVGVAGTQDEETGDGTTAAVVLAGEPLARVEDLLDSWGHPTVVANGSRFAAAEARDALGSMAVEAFSGALEAIPRTLAENAGLDPIDSLVAPRARHAAGGSAAGLDAYPGEVSDMFELHAVEPLRVRRRAVDGATEAVELLLRVDDVVAAGPVDDDGSDRRADIARPDVRYGDRRSVTSSTSER